VEGHSNSQICRNGDFCTRPLVKFPYTRPCHTAVKMSMFSGLTTTEDAKDDYFILHMRVELENKDPTVMFISSEKTQVGIKPYRSAYCSVLLPFISPCHKETQWTWLLLPAGTACGFHRSKGIAYNSLSAKKPILTIVASAHTTCTYLKTYLTNIWLVSAYMVTYSK
jgi:hypothetical protein